MTTTCKRKRADISQAMSTTNSYKEFEQEFNDTKTNIKIEKTIKSPSIFAAKVDNFTSFSQLLKEIATEE